MGLNILLVSPNCAPSDVGGLRTLVYNLADFLSRKHHVTIMTFGTKEEPTLEGLIRYHYARTTNLYARKPLVKVRVTSFGTLRLLKKLLETGNEGKWDVVHCIDPLPAGLSVLIYKHVFRQKFKYIVGPPTGYTYELKRFWFLRPWAKLVCEKSCGIIYSCYAMKRTLSSMLGVRHKNSILIREGVDTTQFRPDLDMRSLRKRLNLYGRRVILSVGRLGSPRKGFGFLLEAVSIVKKKYPNVALVLPGGNPPRHLESTVKELELDQNVFFTGFVPSEQLPYYYALSEVFVLASIEDDRGVSETYPLSALEAIASGKPVILTDVGGNAEIVRGNGFLVPQKDPKKIAEKILELLENRELADKMGKKSREMALKMDWRDITQRLEEFYLACANS